MEDLRREAEGIRGVREEVKGIRRVGGDNEDSPSLLEIRLEYKL